MHAEGDVANCEVGRDVAHVEFVLQGYLDGEASESHGGEGCHFGVYACDSGDEEVGFCEVKQGREG